MPPPFSFYSLIIYLFFLAFTEKQRQICHKSVIYDYITRNDFSQHILNLAGEEIISSFFLYPFGKIVFRLNFPSFRSSNHRPSAFFLLNSEDVHAPTDYV
jgi:hypothetical protein